MDSRSPLFIFRLFGHTIEQHSDLRCITIDGYMINFSPKEYALMALLLQHASYPGDFASCTKLSRICQRPPVDFRRLLSRRISDIRAKLWPFELDILNVGDQGYMLTYKLTYL